MSSASMTAASSFVGSAFSSAVQRACRCPGVHERATLTPGGDRALLATADGSFCLPGHRWATFSSTAVRMCMHLCWRPPHACQSRGRLAVRGSHLAAVHVPARQRQPSQRQQAGCVRLDLLQCSQVVLLCLHGGGRWGAGMHGRHFPGYVATGLSNSSKRLHGSPPHLLTGCAPPMACCQQVPAATRTCSQDAHHQWPVASSCPLPSAPAQIACPA